ncbi:MAG: heavy metal sensor histidine kinase [Casimicrobium sp.]
MSFHLLRHSLAARIALAAATLGLSVMAMVSVLGYVALSYQLKWRAIEDIEAKRTLLQHILSEISSSATLSTEGHRLDDVLIGHEDLHLAVFDVTGSNVIAAFSPLARDASALMLKDLTASRLSAESAMREWTAPSGQRLLVTMGKARLASGEMTQIAILQDRKADARLLSNYAKAVTIGLPLALMVALAGAWLTARSGLRPLRRFATVAGSVSSQSLSGRIDIDGLPSELRDLATSFNAMLGRIDEGVTRLTQFSADLAHEMRTPIATLLGRTQVALSRARDAEALRDTLASNVEELERLTRLIADMLFLAHAETHLEVPDAEVLQLDVETRVVAEFLSLVAEERDLAITVSGAAQVRGNRILIQRAITNLLSNALRHARVGSTVRAEILPTVEGTHLSITNGGDSIATAHTARIFERFYRVESDRSRTSGGTGLGLAITRSIMRAHGGDVRVDCDECALTTFTLSFPRD